MKKMSRNKNDVYPPIMCAHNNKNSSPKLRYRMTFLARFAIFVLLLLPLSALMAATANNPSTDDHDTDDDARWFQVELILFSQQTDLALDAEQWPDIEGLKLPEKLLELHLPQPKPSTEDPLAPADDASSAEADTNPALEMSTEDDSDMPVAYQILPNDQLQLTTMAEKLQRSPKRDLLLHIAWQQPTYDRKHAEPVYFAADMVESPPVDENENNAETGINLPSPGEITELSGLEYAMEEGRNIGPSNPQFVGTVTLSVERYLHIATDLIYRQAITQHKPIPVPDLELWYDRPYPTLHEPQGPAFQQAEWQAVRGFQLKESRRMRSTEIHYLDHPFMGMVVVITPVELPEAAEEIQQTSPQNFISVPSRVRTSP